MDVMKGNTHSQHMKTTVILGLCILLGAGFISVRAADNPAQAAARAVLLQKLKELDHPQTPVPPAPALTPTPAPAPSIAPSMAPAQDALPGIVVPHRHIREMV
jgi:hypothetical protein